MRSSASCNCRGKRNRVLLLWRLRLQGLLWKDCWQQNRIAQTEIIFLAQRLCSAHVYFVVSRSKWNTREGLFWCGVQGFSIFTVLDVVCGNHRRDYLFELNRHCPARRICRRRRPNGWLNRPAGNANFWVLVAETLLLLFLLARTRIDGVCKGNSACQGSKQRYPIGWDSVYPALNPTL